MRHGLGFLATAAVDYGTRLSRLRWRRRVGESSRELPPDARASDALAGFDVWIIVRDVSALPLDERVGDATPPAGRVLVGSGTVGSSGLAVHTLRELESARPEGSSEPFGSAAVLAFRVSEFPPRPGETIEGFVSRLLTDESRCELSPRLAALQFEDSSARERPEILAALPPSAARLLDVGCGAAGTSARFVAQNPSAVATGIERRPDLACAARGRISRVLEGDAIAQLETLAAARETFDAFLFADVLEHLEDPVRALGLARSLASDGATLVASVPNVGHLSVVRDLLLGRFDPLPAGLLDAGHLRWFTRATLHDFLEEAGWQVASVESLASAPAPCAAGFLSHFSDAPALDRRSLDTYQWLAVARPAIRVRAQAR